MATEVAVIVAVVITVVALWAYFTAQRLNTLHIRTDAALAQLQAALDRRAAVLSVVNEECAPLCRRAESIPLVSGRFDARADAERELAAMAEAAALPKPEQLIDADVRVRLAHRFYNEAVMDTRALRLRPLVRIMRLGGTAKLPEYFELTEAVVDSQR